MGSCQSCTWGTKKKKKKDTKEWPPCWGEVVMVEGFQSRSAEAKLDKLVLGAAVQELEKTKTYKNIFPPVSWIVDSPSSGGSPQKPPQIRKWTAHVPRICSSTEIDLPCSSLRSLHLLWWHGIDHPWHVSACAAIGKT